MESNNRSIFYSNERYRPIVDREFLILKIQQAEKICSLLKDEDKRKIRMQRSLKFLQCLGLSKGVEKRKNTRHDTIVEKYNEFLKQGLPIKILTYLTICQNRIICYNKDLIEVFEQKKINKFEFMEMGYKSPGLFTCSADKVLGFFLELNQYGLTDDKIADMLYKKPTMVGNAKQKNQSIFELLINLSLSPTQVGEILYKRPDIMTSGVDNIKSSIKKLREWGYSDNECGSIVYRYPSICTYSTDAMQLRYDTLQTYMQDSQLKDMIYRKPSIMGGSLQKIKSTIQELKKYVFDADKIGSILYRYPSILTYDIHRTQKKGDIFRNYGMESCSIGDLYINFPNIIGYENQRIQSHLENIYKAYNVDVLTHRGIFWFNPDKLHKLLKASKNEEEVMSYINQYHEVGKTKVYGYQGIVYDCDSILDDQSDL